MLFVELRFVLFGALVLAVHWGLSGHEARKKWLLLCSYVFYGAWDARFLALIVGSTLLDHVAARGIAGAASRRGRRAWLLASLVGNLGALGFFKYWDFFVLSAAELLAFLGLPASAPTLELVLPVGISFYTFQTLSYTLDVYHGRLAPCRRLSDLALFVAFFPQLVAGPIVRASAFLPQLEQPRRLDTVPWRAHLTRFLLGWFKKAVLADHAAAVADLVFADPAAHGTGALWLGAALYAVQIYGDFSGYSDMAIATGGMLGYALPENFLRPYLAASVTDFWRRWHVSLSTWFRDYLYLPLGGNRGGPLRTWRNLLVVFVLCGLWHGAAVTFLAWGLFHGAFLVLERLAGPRAREGGGPLRVASTLLVVLVGWVLFRSPDLASAGLVLAGMAGAAGGTTSLSPAWWLLVLGFAAGHAWGPRLRLEARLAALRPDLFAPVYGALVAVLLPWAAADVQPFVYFQF